MLSIAPSYDDHGCPDARLYDISRGSFRPELASRSIVFTSDLLTHDNSWYKHQTITMRVAATTPTTTTTTPTPCPKCVTDKNGKRSCCFRGGSWFLLCGDAFPHTWAEGLQACKSKLNANRCACLADGYSVGLSCVSLANARVCAHDNSLL